MRRRLTAALAAALILGTSGAAQAQDRSPAIDLVSGAGWQCVTFARLFTGIQLFGDAWTWWSQAASKYARGFTPKSGSVLVFKPFGSMSHGHVAVVSQVLTDRIIQVTHANWSRIGGARGRIEKDVTVVDVSPSGDWSQVKVWYDAQRDVGRTVYPTYGFVYKAARTVADVLQGASAAAG